MKKAILFLFLSLSFSGFAQSRQGLVIDDGVRLRRYPGLDAEIVGKKDKKSIINIYSYSGSGKNDNIHIVFALAPGMDSLNYRNLRSFGRIQLEAIVHQTRIEIGDIIWAFSVPIFASEQEKENVIKNMSAQYVNSILQAHAKKEDKPSDESINNPEIATGLEKIRKDYPIGTKIAFIIMKFGDTTVHKEMIHDIKAVLKKHGIVGLRADDKEYMDDLFLNVKVYMHTCDFGIAIYERILSDDFNPNVSLEVGYLLGMKKPVMLLKDQTLKSLNTDLTGKLYKEFDTTNTKGSITNAIEKWLSDKGYI